MEPMTLGSPVNSPVQNPCSPGGTSMYLPSFLLGDTNIVSNNFLYIIITLLLNSFNSNIM